MPAITANHFDGDHHSMRILWEDDAHTVYDFFLMMFPTHMLADFAFWTSTVLKDAGQAEASPLKVLGFLYGMTVHPYGDRRRYWSVETVRIASFLLQQGKSRLSFIIPHPI